MYLIFGDHTYIVQKPDVDMHGHRFLPLRKPSNLQWVSFVYFLYKLP